MIAWSTFSETRASLLERMTLIRRSSAREDLHVERLADKNEQSDVLTRNAAAALQLDKRAREIREIEAALKRCEDGTYGECETCGERISPKRLKAIPWARNCVRCQESLDNSHEPECECRFRGDQADASDCPAHGHGSARRLPLVAMDDRKDCEF